MKCYRFAFLLCAHLAALPSGHKVQQGQVKFAKNKNQTVITSGKNAVIHWDKFSVGEGEMAKFQMKDSKSRVINRVTGGNKSEILGRMESNGKVYLLNHKGILFGKECEINVGGLVASTLDILEQGGNLVFEGDSKASIVNLGKISAREGEVFLFAHKIENRGSIQAQTMGMGSGSQILLKPKGSERIFIKAGSSDGSIDHSGTINAVAVELKTKSAYEMAINLNGLVEAKGGEVYIQGGKITLASETIIDVSNQEGPAGVLKVGENYVQVDEGVQVFASGKPGGEVRFKADKMYFYGKVTARGLDGSNGGFVEISAIEGDFELNQKIDCSPFGTIFHDPPTITIDVSASSGPTVFGDSYINTTLAGSNLTIATTGPGFESITFVGPGSPAISWTGESVFTLTSGGTIFSTAAAPTISNTAVAGGVDVMVFTANSGGGTAGNFTGIDFTPVALSVDANNIVLDGTGGDTGSSNLGVMTGDMSATTSGNITVTGTGGGSGASNFGIRFTGTTTTGSGDLIAMGTGGLGTSGNTGISEAAFGGLTTASGLIRLTGIGGGSGTGVGNHGVEIPETAITSTSATFSAGKGIEIIGTGGSGIGSSYGVNFSDTPASVSSVANPITITGVGGSGGTSNYGISHQVEATVSSTTSGITGTITYMGTGGSGTGDCVGVFIPIDVSPVIFSDGSDINITGIAGPTATSAGNIGIDIIDNIITTGISGGAGNIALVGTGSSVGTTINHGIRIASGGEPTGVSALGGGNISLTGTGGGASSADNSGVRIIAEAKLLSTTGNITVIGSALGGTDENYGAFFEGVNTLVETSGNIIITGTSNGSNFNNKGVVVMSSAAITALGTGTMTVTGIGGLGSSDCAGIFIDHPSVISTVSGDLMLDGTGGISAGIRSHGIVIDGLSIVGSPEIVTDSGTLTAIGREGGTDNKGILLTARGAMSTTSGPLFITTLSDLDIESGGQILGGSSLITLDIDRDLNILGTLSNTGIFPGTGGVTGVVGRDLTLVGSATGGAHIGSINPFGLSADITFTSIGRNVLVDGSSSAPATGLGYAVIGHGKNTGAPYSGDILLSDVGGTVTVKGGDTAVGSLNGVGQIGHIALADSDLLNGNISIRARGDINVTGGSATALSYGRIGHGGRPGIVFGTTSSLMTLIADSSITMTSQIGGGVAVITNPSTSAINGTLTLVIDNANPAPPNFGAAGFSINTDSDLSVPNSSGELRVYTVQPSQNTVGTTVNGSLFTPTPLDVDDATNQYGVYFAGGTFIGGAPFRFYYKINSDLVNQLAAPFIFQSFDLLQVAEAQAIFSPFKAIWHHPSFCGREATCDPGFDPYYSSVFEEDVYWIGANSEETI